MTKQEVLRQAAENIEFGNDYNWIHHGCCNCGQLVKIISGLDKEQILENVIHWQRSLSYQYISAKYADMAESYNFCLVSGLHIPEIVGYLIDFGFSPLEIANLEELSDPKICSSINIKLKRYIAKDVVLYLKTWANILDDEERMNSSYIIEMKPDFSIRVSKTQVEYELI